MVRISSFMTRIAVEGLTRRFGTAAAIDHVDLSIRSGELFFLLGPSGCGKTTFLRLLAGFLDPDEGRVLFDGRDVTRVPPEKRNAGMVFQSFALWPHMTVLENVAYGLRVRRVPAADRRERALATLRSVHMEALADRKPAELSGGEQQRVALARALIIEPHVLLLDEPLSNLDAALRHEMRQEIRRICRQTSITTVYVTHDQVEALAMADTIAVLRAGKVVQIDAPAALYARPRSRFVAAFVGETNLVEATVESERGDLIRLQTPAGPLLGRADGRRLAAGARVTCSVRPEAAILRAGPAPADAGTLSGRLTGSVFLGQTTQHTVELTGGGVFKVSQLNAPALAMEDARVTVAIASDDVVVLDD